MLASQWAFSRLRPATSILCRLEVCRCGCSSSPGGMQCIPPTVQYAAVLTHIHTYTSVRGVDLRVPFGACAVLDKARVQCSAVSLSQVSQVAVSQVAVQCHCFTTSFLRPLPLLITPQFFADPQMAVSLQQLTTPTPLCLRQCKWNHNGLNREGTHF